MNDMSSPPSENTWKIRPFAETLVALRFLTRLPIPFVRTLDLPPLSEGMRDKVAAAGKLKAFMLADPVRGANIKKLIEEGRACLTENV